MLNHDYATLESNLRKAVDRVRQGFAPAQTEEVLDFLDAGEYGLAFESLIFYLVDENVPVSVDLCALLQGAAHRMKYGDNLSEMHDLDLAAAITLVCEACRNCTE